MDNIQLTNSKLPEHEQLVSCPFNKAHMVVRHRMAKHIIKCERTHSRAGTQECRFNISHVFSIEEIKDHEKVCPDRVNVEMSLMHEIKMRDEAPDSGISSIKSSIQSQIQSSKINQDEDWDKADPVPTYNPLKVVRGHEIIRNIQHGTPSMRKLLREKENERILKIQDSKLPKSSNSTY